VRLTDTDTQLRVKYLLQKSLNSDPTEPHFIVALNLQSASPTWLSALHALPMYLGLDLRIVRRVRDADGLACASRNAYLSQREREQATALPRALEAGRSAHAEGSDPVVAARAAFNGLEPDYVELLELDGVKILAAAARVGSTRLVDNVTLEIPCQGSAWLGRTQKEES
jgi:hypothetical protein